MRLSVPSPRSDRRRSGLPGGSSTCRKSELQLLFAAFLEDAQDVSRLAQIETRQRIEERQNAVQLRVLRRDRRVIDQAQRRAVRAVGLAEAIVLQVEAAIVVERRAPQHRAVVHHAVIDVANDFAMAKSAGLLRDAQIAGIDEANELGRFVIEPTFEFGGLARSSEQPL